MASRRPRFESIQEVEDAFREVEGETLDDRKKRQRKLRDARKKVNELLAVRQSTVRPLLYIVIYMFTYYHLYTNLAADLQCPGMAEVVQPPTTVPNEHGT